ncbi:MAG: heparinase II/III family protein [Clostridia bacterium]|nr:heparinase II/III family protein [Clostridia bacterium]
MNLHGIASDPKFWSETVRNGECYKKYVEERLADWDKYCEGQTILDLTYSLYKIFSISGERKTFEDAYFKRRNMLAVSAVLSLIYPEEEKYIDFLQDIIFAICDEYTWSIAAHHPDINVHNKWHIDLFAAETGFALSEVYTLLGDRLDVVIRERIKYEVNERIIESFMNNHTFWWETRCTNNWAAVCGGSVGCTFMIMRPDLFDEIKPRFDAIMEAFLSGFKNDGYCLEGTSYWHYGFGFFLTYADMVKTYTDGKENYFEREKVRKIATFIQKMFLSEMCSVSFADGDLSLKYHLGTLHYLKKLYPDDVKVFSPEYSYTKDGCARFCLMIRSASWLDTYIYNNPEVNEASAEYYAEESNWFVKRTASYGFAAKAGNNNEHHNHNDVGTFIFAKDGKQILTDMGRGVYCKQYFRTETRYDMIECSSLGHNVPHFGGKIKQCFGRKFEATDVNYKPGEFSMDIAGAYGDDTVKSIKRTFVTDDNSVRVYDVFDYSGEEKITERLTSYVKPEVSDGCIKLDCGTVLFDNAKCSVSVSEVVTSKNNTVYLIDFELNRNVCEFEMIIK